METLNLVKGQKVDLTKGTAITEVIVGLGWDEVTRGGAMDLDASVVELDNDGKYKNLVYFSKKESAGITHLGDNLTGEGDGDDEQIVIKLNEVSSETSKLKFVVNIYQAGNRNFGQVDGAFVRVVDKATNKELLKYDLSEDYSTATGVIVGEMYRHNGEWKFTATDEGFVGDLGALTTMF